MPDAADRQADETVAETPRAPKGQPRAEAAAQSPTPQEGKRKLKVEGAELEFSEQDIEKYASLGVASQRRFLEAKAEREAAEKARAEAAQYLHEQEDWRRFKSMSQDSNPAVRTRFELIQAIANEAEPEQIAQWVQQLRELDGSEEAVTYRGGEVAPENYPGLDKISRKLDKLEKFMDAFVSEREETKQQKVVRETKEANERLDRELTELIRNDRFLSEEDFDVAYSNVVGYMLRTGVEMKAAVQRIGAERGKHVSRTRRSAEEVKREDAKADASLPPSSAAGPPKRGWQPTPTSMRDGTTKRSVLEFMRQRRGQQ